MRNSSLVKRICADNVTGLKHTTEDRDDGSESGSYGRGAFHLRGRRSVRVVGANGSANAGMSSEK